ncbi:hypothetical protein Ancab_002246 [Ancistrocladus abbreviatus]
MNLLVFPSAVSCNEEDVPSNYMLPKQDLPVQSNQFDAFGDGSGKEPFLRKLEPGIAPTKAPVYEVHGKAESSRAMGAPRSAAYVQQHLAPKINLADLFTYQQITSAVAATEQLRMFCSLTMAFLVVTGSIIYGISYCKKLAYKEHHTIPPIVSSFGDQYNIYISTTYC